MQFLPGGSRYTWRFAQGGGGWKMEGGGWGGYTQKPLRNIKKNTHFGFIWSSICFARLRRSIKYLIVKLNFVQLLCKGHHSQNGSRLGSAHKQNRSKWLRVFNTFTFIWWEFILLQEYIFYCSRGVRGLHSTQRGSWKNRACVFLY